ncbi:MAG: hypothetical protein IIA63_02385 [Nitrospinae bacterium]|nr:hypothetical protein [Nitrospinota bacterium]
MAKINDDWWPDCFSHYKKPLISDIDKEITVAKIYSEEKNGKNVRNEMFFTALIPLKNYQKIINVRGGIGDGEVRTSGPFPCVDKEGTYEPHFWIQGSRQGQSFDPLVVSWSNHNKRVMVPDNGFLMTYGLIPRITSQENKIIWDDPGKPQYDVVVVEPLSNYEMPFHSKAQVKILREYLEDYFSIRGCAGIAIYYEDNLVPRNSELEEILNGQQGIEIELSGRRIIVATLSHDADNLFLRIWGSTLLLEPKSRPLTDDNPQTLNWPGFGEISHEKGLRSRHTERVLVKDTVLIEYEGSPEYIINPMTGSVNYDGRWGISSCFRVGRDFISIELKSLYEGCPNHITEYWNQFACEPELVEKVDKKEPNIGLRAQNLIYSYLDLEGELGYLALNLGLEDDDLYSLNRKELNYHGWWTYEDLKPLGYVVPKEINEEQFLNRCKNLYKLFEGLKESKLREIIKEWGCREKDIDKYRSLKLLGVLTQFIEVATESGLNFFEDQESIIERCDFSKKVVSLGSSFALNELRLVDAHKLGMGTSKTVDTALEVFGMNRKEMMSGWGLALDKIYDQVEESIRQIVSKIQKVNV